MHEFENELNRKYPEDHPESRFDIRAGNLHHAPRSDGCTDEDRDNGTEDQGDINTAARHMSEYAEQGREDHDKTDHAGGIFRRIQGFMGCSAWRIFSGICFYDGMSFLMSFFPRVLPNPDRRKAAGTRI